MQTEIASEAPKLRVSKPTRPQGWSYNAATIRRQPNTK